MMQRVQPSSSDVEICMIKRSVHLRPSQAVPGKMDSGSDPERCSECSDVDDDGESSDADDDDEGAVSDASSSGGSDPSVSGSTTPALAATTATRRPPSSAANRICRRSVRRWARWRQSTRSIALWVRLIVHAVVGFVIECNGGRS